MRRNTILIAFLSVLIFGGLGLARAATTTPATPAVAPPLGWSMAIIAVQDPYQGVILTPKTPNPTMRYIGIQLTMSAGDFPLTVKATSVRLRDAKGEEFSGGVTFGADIHLADRQVLPGERDTGWVWFEVPANSTMVQIAFIALTTPELRLPYSAAPMASPGVAISTTTPSITKTPRVGTPAP